MNNKFMTKEMEARVLALYENKLSGKYNDTIKEAIMLQCMVSSANVLQMVYNTLGAVSPALSMTLMQEEGHVVFRATAPTGQNAKVTVWRDNGLRVGVIKRTFLPLTSADFVEITKASQEVDELFVVMDIDTEADKVFPMDLKMRIDSLYRTFENNPKVKPFVNFKDGLTDEDQARVLTSVIKSNVDVTFNKGDIDTGFNFTTEDVQKDWTKYKEHLSEALVKYFTKRDQDSAKAKESK